MKNAILLSLLICYTSFLLAQTEVNYSHDEGRVTQYEMSMTEYPDDPDASALVIHELGDYYFQGEDEEGFILHMKKKIKIKILKQAGLEYATIEIPYYIDKDNKEEKVLDIIATTYNYVDGKLIKTQLDKKAIFEEKINTRWKLKKFAMPDVKEGSVIEVSYHISTPFYFNMMDWRFQKKIPVVYSKLEYKAIPYFEYAYILKGIDKFDEFDSKMLLRDHYFGRLKYKEMLFTIGLNNIPAFKDEEFISSSKDYMIAVNFQIAKVHHPTGGSREYLSTWPKMIADILSEEGVGKYMKNSEKEAKKILPAIALEGKSQKEQLELITNYVKDNYACNGYWDKYATQSLSEFQKKKTGNSADINLFLIGMLKAANLSVNPVMLSTRNHGAVSKAYPFRQFFNYIIAKVDIDSTTYLIDATNPLLNYDELPVSCVNVMGLVLKPKAKEEEWVFTMQQNTSSTTKIFEFEAPATGGVTKVQTRYETLGHDSYPYREAYEGNAENIKDYLREKKKITTADNVKVDEITSTDKPFAFNFDFNTNIESVGNKLFIHPFCNMSLSVNLFKQTSRTLAIDLIYLQGEKYKSEITIPEGYKVEYLPKSSNISSRIMDIKYSAKEEDGKVVVEAEYFFNLNIYPAEAYPQLKFTVDAVIERFSEMIVLVKE